MSMTIDGTAGLTFPNGSGQSVVGGLGIGQNWVDVTSSRALGTTYTNDTGKPIMVNICIAGGSGGESSAFVNGVRVVRVYISSINAAGWTSSFIVPNGSTYSVTSGTGVSLWAELR